MASKTSTRETWLTDVAGLKPGERIFLYPRGDLDVQTGQRALNAQYGPGVYWCSTHGQAFRAGHKGTRQ